MFVLSAASSRELNHRPHQFATLHVLTSVIWCLSVLLATIAGCNKGSPPNAVATFVSDSAIAITDAPLTEHQQHQSLVSNATRVLTKETAVEIAKKEVDEREFLRSPTAVYSFEAWHINGDRWGVMAQRVVDFDTSGAPLYASGSWIQIVINPDGRVVNYKYGR